MWSLRWLKMPIVISRTGTLIGCAFAAQRKYFFDVGAFDEGMVLWGVENVELPIRVSSTFTVPEDKLCYSAAFFALVTKQ